jgi:hypothetical protein
VTAATSMTSSTLTTPQGLPSPASSTSETSGKGPFTRTTKLFYFSLFFKRIYFSQVGIHNDTLHIKLWQQHWNV